MNDDFNINLDEIPDEPTYESVPAGEYVVSVVESNIQATKAQDGRYLKLKYEIQKGEYQGRFLWKIYNFDNKNEKTVKRAKTEIKNLSLAMGLTGELKSHFEFIGRPILIRYDLNWKKEIDILSYKSILEAAPATKLPNLQTPNDDVIPF